MPTRGSHYERAFESYLRHRRTRFVLLSDAKKIVAGEHARLQAPENDAGVRGTLKSFDLIVYGLTAHTLVDVKGRKISSPLDPDRRPRLESWVTEDDVSSLRVWEQLFGPGHEAAFAFIYWCPDRPPAIHFDDAFEHHGRWYGIRAITLAEYTAAMHPRSPKWRTVHLRSDMFDRLSRPLFPAA